MAAEKFIFGQLLIGECDFVKAKKKKKKSKCKRMESKKETEESPSGLDPFRAFLGVIRRAPTLLQRNYRRANCLPKPHCG